MQTSLVQHDAAEVVGPVTLQLWAQVFLSPVYVCIRMCVYYMY
jgi:hypothetical protein